MNKYVLKSSQLIHLVRQQKFPKKAKKIATARDDPLNKKKMIEKIYTR